MWNSMRTRLYAHNNANPREQQAQKGNFFIEHPEGTFAMAYPKGLDAMTAMESLSAAEAHVATLTFTAKGDGDKARATLSWPTTPQRGGWTSPLTGRCRSALKRGGTRRWTDLPRPAGLSARTCRRSRAAAYHRTACHRYSS